MSRLVGGFLTLTPEFCLVVEDDVGLVGYALAALDAKQFHKKLELAWLPEMCRKYPRPEENAGEALSNTDVNKVVLLHLHIRYFCGLPTCTMRMHCSSIAIDECSLNCHNIQYGQRFHSDAPLYLSWNMSGEV